MLAIQSSRHCSLLNNNQSPAYLSPNKSTHQDLTIALTWYSKPTDKRHIWLLYRPICVQSIQIAFLQSGFVPVQGLWLPPIVIVSQGVHYVRSMNIRPRESLQQLSSITSFTPFRTTNHRPSFNLF